MLARQPDDISMGEIVRVLEGSLDLADCIEDQNHAIDPAIV